jgi:Cupin domain
LKCEALLGAQGLEVVESTDRIANRARLLRHGWDDRDRREPRTGGLARASTPPSWFDETFSILDGELTFQVGTKRVLGCAGDTLFVARDVHHTLANLSAGSARYLLVCTPGGFEQRFGPEPESTPSGPNTDIVVVGPRIPEMETDR